MKKVEYLFAQKTQINYLFQLNLLLQILFDVNFSNQIFTTCMKLIVIFFDRNFYYLHARILHKLSKPFMPKSFELSRRREH